GGDSEITRVGRANSSAYGRDFVFSLNGVHAECFVSTQLMEHVTCRRDGISAHDHGDTCEFSRSDKAPGGGDVTANVPIEPLLRGMARYFGAVVSDLSCLAKSMSGLEGKDV